MNACWKLPAAISASVHLLLLATALLIPLSPPPLVRTLPAVVEIVPVSVFEPPQLISQGDKAPLTDDDPAPASAAVEEPAAADPEPEPDRPIAPEPDSSSQLPLLAGNSVQPSLAPLVKAGGSGEVKPAAGYQAGRSTGGNGEATGGGSGGGSSARVVSRGKPHYPPAAREAGWEGAVVVGILIDERGRAATVTVRESSGYTALDEAAVEAVKKWRFAPAKRNGEAVASLHVVRVKFNLTDPD